MATRQRYLMFFSYIGSRFRGSQLQLVGNPEIETVQNVLEKGLKHVFQAKDERPFFVHLASRTDAGVHALRTALSVDLPEHGYGFLRPRNLKSFMNSYFKQEGDDVRILEVHMVPDTFNIHKSRLDKTYLYRVGILKNEFFRESIGKTVPALEVGRAELIRNCKIFDFEKAAEATPLFEGTKDYAAIVGKPSRNTCSTICNIMSYTIEKVQPFLPVDPIAQKYDFYHIICKGDRFLYHMIRRMVGLTLAVGFGDATLADIKKLFDEPVPSSWPRISRPEVSGCGLYLVNINVDFQKLNKDFSVKGSAKGVNQVKL